ncbi:hypothetical protein [Flavobacterium pokkalii]|uniref:hypothetical protein n=1 Tax=Flavobacterium pokkalii TaxID=1940408 RepID=UPI001660B65A|nr:hypothetical protein [Flavobacterium pokkalii]
MFTAVILDFGREFQTKAAIVICLLKFLVFHLLSGDNLISSLLFLRKDTNNILTIKSIGMQVLVCSII